MASNPQTKPNVLVVLAAFYTVKSYRLLLIDKSIPFVDHQFSWKVALPAPTADAAENTAQNN